MATYTCDPNFRPLSPYLPGTCPQPEPTPETVIGLIEEEETVAIPAGATGWSISVTGTGPADVNGVDVPTGASLSGSGPLDVDLEITTPAGTEVSITYIAP